MSKKFKLEIVKADVKEIVGDALFEFFFGLTFFSFLCGWFFGYFLFSTLDRPFNFFLILRTIIVVIFIGLNSLSMIQLLRKLFELKLRVALLSIGSLPIFVLGIWGLLIFLVIALAGTLFSIHALAKNILSVCKETSHLIATPILLYLSLTAFVGVTEYRSEIIFSDSVATLLGATVDVSELADTWKPIKQLFYDDVQQFGSYSPIGTDMINSTYIKIKPQLIKIKTKGNHVLNLTKNIDAVAFYYIRKSANILIGGSAFIENWVTSAEFASEIYYSKNITLESIGILRTGLNNLNSSFNKFNEAVSDPIWTFLLLSGKIKDIQSDMQYFLKQLEWAIYYYPSLNIIQCFSSQYDENSDSLTIELQLFNNGNIPIRLDQCRVGTNFEPISWQNFDYLEEIYGLCLKPTNVTIQSNSDILKPNYTAVITMNFIDVRKSISRYVLDFRTFERASLFVIFLDTYIQIPAREAFKNTMHS